MASYVLIAEFDPRQAAIYREAVERHGIEAVLVRDGAAAGRVLQTRGAPSLLISDLSLPQADGFSVIADLRRLAPPGESAVLVFSAHAPLRAAALNLRSTLGIAEVEDKNQPPDVITETIRRTLETTAHVVPQTRTREDGLLHKILARTAKVFRSPVVLISLELRQRRLVAGHVGLNEVRGGPQFWPVLQQVVHSGEPLVIPDTTRHSLFGVGPQSPAFGIRAFAAVPLTPASGRPVGAMSLLDFQPHSLTALQLDLLLQAARRIADELAAYYKDDLADPQPPAEAWRSKEQWAALERLALTDRLTALSNRHAGEQVLERELARLRRIHAPFSIALIDVDRFKRVNDRFGHSVGDDVLKQVSRVLTSTFRASDLAIRWGGDEFLVLLPDVPAAGAVVFAERARAQVEKLAFPGVGAVTISAGVVQIRAGEDARGAIRRADAQLYEAKRSGRNLIKTDNGTADAPLRDSGTPRTITAHQDLPAS